ncbi:AgmX/PglI C-terminal domain-containing protein [bacterium]|nr:AgmX/PglI C-terminal domain-containing protein [bacterium]
MKSLTASASLTNPLVLSFPKEFQKGIWKSIDKRYAAILTATFILCSVLLIQRITQTIPLKASVDIMHYIKKNPKIIGLTYEDMERIDVTKTIETTKIDVNVKTHEQLKKLDVQDRKTAYQNMIKQKVAERMQRLDEQMKNYLKKFETDGNNKFGFLTNNNSNQQDVNNLIIAVSNDNSIKSSLINGNIQLLTSTSNVIDDPNFKTDPNNLARVEFKNTSNELVKFSSSTIERKNAIATVSASDISLAIANYETAVQLTYQRFLKNDPNLKGKVGVRIVFDSTGKVTTVTVIENTTGNSDFAQALIGKIKTWQFPKYTRKAGLITINQSFVFGK